MSGKFENNSVVREEDFYDSIRIRPAVGNGQSA